MTEKKNSKLKEWGEKFKSIFSKYPVTMVVIILLTIFMALIYEEGGIFGIFDPYKTNPIITREMLNKIMMFGFTYALSSLFVETVFKRKKKVFTIVGLIIMAIIDMGFIIAFERFEGITDTFNRKFLYDWLTRYYAMYLITLFIVIIHKSYKSMETSLEEYLAKVMVNVCKIGIIYGILAIGILAISYGLLVALLELDEVIILRIETFLFGLYFAPQIINALFDKDVNVGKFAKAIIRYVLEPLFICALAILYLYFIKIVFIHEMPKNILYRVIASMFVCGFFIWTLNDYFKDETLLFKINKFLPLAFTPAFIMQAYCIAIRVIDNNITPLRYAGIMIVIFEAIYILVYMIKKEHVEKLLFVILALIAISVICPFVNAPNIARITQNDILKQYVAAGKQIKDYSIENIKIIQGAYDYLDDKYVGTKLIEETLTKEQIEDINSISIIYDYRTQEYKISGQGSDDNTSVFSNTYYINCKDESKVIDVSEYSMLYELNTVSDYSIRQKVDDIFANLEFNTYNVDDVDLTKTIECTVDLSKLANKLVSEYINNANDVNKYFNEHNEIEVNENEKLIIKKFYIEYIPDSELVYSYDIDAVLLEK